MGFPVVTGVSSVLAHVPGLVRYGSKPSRELHRAANGVVDGFLESLRGYEEAVAYPPHQVFIGNVGPDDLVDRPRPWFQNPLGDANRFGPFGEIMPEEEFLGLLRIADEFNLLLLESEFVAAAKEQLAKHPLIGPADLDRLGAGTTMQHIRQRIDDGSAIPIHVQKDRLVGCFQRAHDEDESLTAPILIENLASKASAVLALRSMLRTMPHLSALDIDYLLGCGEEAVGDRYNRGGGNLAKAVGELSGCQNATGSDIKAFCCAPVHAVVLAAALVQAGIFNRVAVIGGGSLAKLGMKFRGHLANNMPILEDVLGAIAVMIENDDGVSPRIRLDSVGKHDISSGSSPQAILEALITRPLDRLGMKILDVNKYALEMHNPEITEPAGSGNVPRTNYRMVGSIAVLKGEIKAGDLDWFARVHGMPGFSPTQGHIAAGIPYLGHARNAILSGKMDNAMFVAKGSLFLGRMTNLSDGMSFIIERNGR